MSRRTRIIFAVRYAEGLVFVVLLLIFMVKVVNYADIDALQPATAYRTATATVARTYHRISGLAVFHSCPSNLQKVAIPDGYVCRQASEISVWQRIYDTYPQYGNGIEVVYPFLDRGSIDNANALMQNKIPVDRFEPFDIGGLPNWTEDPYKDPYWRFSYYGLRPMINLLYAGRTTHDGRYNAKLIELVASFIDTGTNQPRAWDDSHAVAFRTMVLTNAWWKLRQQHALTLNDSTKILQSIKTHGDYLSDSNHYEPQSNHGINEAAALLLLATAMKDIPGADAWRSIATSRLSYGVRTLVDDDGALIENSPYYHFYALQKYWNVYKYLQAQHISMTPEFKRKIDKMIDYATYILQPNSQTPLLGASLAATIHRHNEFADIADSYPNFMYAITQGARGKKPPKLNTFYADTGQTIMRSGWGEGNDYAKQTQLIFDVGAFRTQHSNYDALSFSLYANGKALLTDGGLYTYEAGKHRDYFQGTYGHNTVLVDGKSQSAGSAVPGKFVEKDGYVYQTAVSQLYSGVTHERAIVMIDKNHFLIIDKLLSDEKHTYEQLFHLFPGAKLSKDGLTVTGSGDAPGQSVTIKQLFPAGITESDAINQSDPINGVCSEQYGKLIPCHAVSYKQITQNATYYTELTIGEGDKDFQIQVSTDGKTASIRNGSRTLSLGVGQGQSIQGSAAVNNSRMPEHQRLSVDAFAAASHWTANVPGILRQPESVPPAYATGAFTAAVPPGQSTIITNDRIRLDLSKSNTHIPLKCNGRDDASAMAIEFSNNNWQSYVSNDLRSAYRVEYDGQWVNLSFGKSQLRERNGHWRTVGDAFDWSKIDGVRFVLNNGNVSKPINLDVGQMAAVPEQKTGVVVMVFDDGYNSILPAAEYLRQNNMKANVAVATRYLRVPSGGHLNLDELKMLQNAYGWNMVSHTERHQDAVETYYKTKRMERYEEDVLAAAKFLEDHGINSAPNWFIYPHGATNADIKAIVGKYYKFARTTANDTEIYPFGEPLGVKTLSVQNAQDVEMTEDGVVTTPQQVAAAVSDAKIYKTTLFLTFHRIHSKISDRPGYDIDDFKAIVDDIKRQGIPVMTLSELDQHNGVPANSMTFKPASPPQLQLTISEARTFWQQVGYALRFWSH